ncbi:hypothetical protein RF656_21105 [Yersinia kristensenii]|uniref:hypothetical protein n=1 Tax=Yersinia kristensenii TaxID=28152 RepID=UPI0028533D18|nr:hypothetical protein [Yersinia kristensenii]MDR4899217.1 hypothetical protein [Yersinia kristensenii]
MKKKKTDGTCEYLRSDDYTFLIMRGDYDKDAIIKAAIEQGEIHSDDAEDWQSANYYQSHYKVTPIGGGGGYSTWHHPRDTPCKGSFFASVLQWD